MSANLDHYEVVHAEWSIPPDVVAIEHHRPEPSKRCLVASSTLPRTLTEVLEAIEAHDKECT